jgi:DNA polymerase III delta prime subunit
MADYEFRSLSPHDFEMLSRDLLQKPLGVRLESFTAGRDSGIDFRYRRGDVNLIVQCKHYAESGYEALARVLKSKERKKLDALKPTRYILATSVGLTPDRKKEILEILSPYCAETNDILGRDDLNNLLTQYPEIERQHFKLWLTSAAVLERVLNAGIFSESDRHLERIRQRLSRYVSNPSLQRAQEVLEKSHFCIVAGIPGIGKTTLAEVLLTDLVDRHGYSAYRVTHDLSELQAIKNPKSKQVFYFDDFLGKTALDKLQKNEDQRLVELLEEVAENSNWRFILTTREYILNMARQHYEAFAHPPVEFKMCVINLSDYTRPARAKILLYNHIYFSDLPREYKLALLEDRGYEKILGHRNYNPRVIEHMTQARHAGTVAPTIYLREFLDNLDNPSRIWEHAFRHQISEAARHLLLALTTLADETKLENLEQAFHTFYEFRRQTFGFPTKPGDWVDALRELDGNFIKTRKIGKDIVVSFHNPSIRDFMELSLEKTGSDALDLLRGAHFHEQYVALWQGIRGHRYQSIEQSGAEFVEVLAKNLWAQSARTIRQVDQAGEEMGVVSHPPSAESRSEFYVRVVDKVHPKAAVKITSRLLDSLADNWRGGSADREDLVHLFRFGEGVDLGISID